MASSGVDGAVGRRGMESLASVVTVGFSCDVCWKYAMCCCYGRRRVAGIMLLMLAPLPVHAVTRCCRGSVFEDYSHPCQSLLPLRRGCL
jgi:hypothetical protein